jgi:hypothetical protein
MLKAKVQPVRKSAPAHQASRKKGPSRVKWEERFGDLDLERYRESIEPDQFELLLEFVGADLVAADFDPSELFHPERE